MNIFTGTVETEEAGVSPTTSPPGTETGAGTAASLEETTTGDSPEMATEGEIEEDTETGRERLPKRDRGSTWLRGAKK